MQFLEKSGLGLRSAVYELRHPTASLSFMLVPMVHVAEPRFYEEVSSHLSRCTTLILEGVPGRRAKFLTLAYRPLGQFNRTGLCEQDDEVVVAGFNGEIIHGDVSEEEFSGSWRSLSWAHRLLGMIIVPVVALLHLILGPRYLAAYGLNVNDLPSRREILASDYVQSISKVLLEDRDRHLAHVIRSHFERHHQSEGMVGIVYGAMHMPAIWRCLQSLGYRVRSANWVTVLGF